MRRNIKYILLTTFLATCYFLLTTSSVHAARDRVQVQNNTVVADNGVPLRGEAMFLTFSETCSTIGNCPGNTTTGNFSLEDLYDESLWREYRDDFHLNTIRLFIMRPPQNWGSGPGANCFPPTYRCFDLDYIIDQDPANVGNPGHGKTALQVIDDAVDIADRLGMYIIIDYHPVLGHDQDDALAWWTQIAPRYKDRTHVIYELANEPHANASFEATVYSHIRNLAPDTHIILWSYANLNGVSLTAVQSPQLVDINAYSNGSVGYHPYWNYMAADSDYWKVQQVKDAGFPVINTEIGYDREDIAKAEDSRGNSWIWLNGAKTRDLSPNGITSSQITWPTDPNAVDSGNPPNPTPTPSDAPTSASPTPLPNPNWGSITIETEQAYGNDVPMVTFENSVLKGVYRVIDPVGQPRSAFQDLIIKSHGTDQVDGNIGGRQGHRYIESNAFMGTLANATILTPEDPDTLTVRLEHYGNNATSGPIEVVKVISIFKDSPVIRVHYQQYDAHSWANIVDIGHPGGQPSGTYKLFGGDQYFPIPQNWNSHNSYWTITPGDGTMVTPPGFGPTDGGPLNYKDHMVMAIANGGAGYGRATPIWLDSKPGGIRILKLLFNQGFETFHRSTGASGYPEFDTYIYVFDHSSMTNEQALDQAILDGQAIVDGSRLNGIPTSPTVTPTPTPTPAPQQPCPLPGDTNTCDGIVNILDYTFLSANFGSSNPQADLKPDGTINVLDYTILSLNFGNTLP